MPTFKVEVKQNKKFDIEPHSLAAALAESWTEYELYDFFSSFMEQLQWEGKEEGVIDHAIKAGYKARFQGWAEGKTW